MKGKFVVLEGPDGAGKTTLAHKLFTSMEEKGHKVLLVREPGGSKAAEVIRNTVLAPEVMDACGNARMLLMFAARMQLCHEVIEPALNDGITVICDRYYLSTNVYQVKLEGASPDLFDALAYKVTRPDHFFVLTAPFDTCYKRTLDRDPNSRNGYDDVSLGKKRAVWQAYHELFIPFSRKPSTDHFYYRQSLMSFLDTKTYDQDYLANLIQDKIR